MSEPTKPPPPPAAPPPQSLFDLHEGTFRMGVPVPDVRPVFTVAQQRQYGRPETAERAKAIPIGRLSVPEDVARIEARRGIEPGAAPRR